MVHIADDSHGECLHLPRGAVRLPVEFRPPDGFDPGDLASWPRLDGRLEYVEGRIRYMPPCGRVQQDVCSDLILLLGNWARGRDRFAVGSNEAGMLLGGEVRAADGAVWLRADVGPSRHELARVAPLLAVEVAGRDEGEEDLREKAQWYLGAGVAIVWLVLPDTREVLVVDPDRETRYGAGARLPEHPALPGLAPLVADFFAQLDRGG
ncbi:MAG TPA: Uma2 family endonuclease [Polyangia bacterium]|jgi:Uma2 family endonuclease